jgi:cobalt-zinc-cadmium efflux system outer membrane protein
MSRVRVFTRSLVALAACAACLAAAAAAQETAPAEGFETLTLAAARERSLAANPELAAAAAQVAAADGASRQARAWRNPDLVVDVEDFGGSLPSDVPTQTTVGVMQSVEWFSKRSARVDAADAARRAAAAAAAVARREVVAATDQRFAELLGAQERRTIASENAATAREVRVAVAARVEAGEVSPIEEQRARGDEALAAIDLARAERDLAAARRELARLWGDARAEVGAAVRPEAVDAAVPPAAALLAALDRIPDVAHADAVIAQRAAQLENAQRQWLPDLTLSVGSRTYAGSGERGYVAGIGVPLPLLTQHAGARAEAEAALAQAQQERRAAAVRVEAAILAAHDALQRARAEVRLLRAEVLPRAEEVYGALGEGYRRGKFRLIDLLESRRALAATRLRVVDAATGADLAAADLHRYTADDAGAEKGSRQ